MGYMSAIYTTYSLVEKTFAPKIKFSLRSKIPIQSLEAKSLKPNPCLFLRMPKKKGQPLFLPEDN